LRFTFIIFAIIFFSCNISKKHEPRTIERSFYFWKSVFKLSTQEKDALTNFKIQNLYIKYFDVDWNASRNTALPVAQLTAPDSIFLRTTKLNIVPTVFITNETIFKININQTEELANKIIVLVNSMNSNFGVKLINELQIDCDWTAGTKDKYFSLLKFLKKKQNNINFSSTIRLHQIKYLNKTGVPPVKKGMLMCYNMGNLSNINTSNSILEVDELKKYIGDLQNYPLPLDVALPIFEWKVLFRNNVFKGIFENMPDSLIAQNIFNKNGNRNKALVDTILNGYEIKKNDIIRTEKSNYTSVLKTAKLISEKLSGNIVRVSFFHLDNLTLKKYKLYEMENIYDAMR